MQILDLLTRGRRRIIGVAAAGAVIAAIGLMATSPASASPASAPSSAASVPAGWQAASAGAGCSSNLHVLVPTESPSYYAAHPAALLPPGSGTTPSILGTASRNASAKIHWIQNLTCAPGHAGKPLPTETSGASNPLYYANWSGYETDPSSYASALGASMTWNVPAVDEPSNLTVVSSIWPGVGQGHSTEDTLVQAGTEQDGACELGCTYHTTSYYFWYETFPQEGQEEITSLGVSPGDLVGSLVEYDPDTGEAYFELTDYTTNLGVYAYQAVTGTDIGSGSTAEWILERTEACGIGSCTYPSLNNFGTEDISSAVAAIGTDWTDYSVETPAQLNADPATMTDCADDETLATTGPLDSTGQDFAITWHNYGPSDPAGC